VAVLVLQGTVNASFVQVLRTVNAVVPDVTLVAYTKEPFGIAVASARTCYAEDFVFVGQLTPKGERTRTTLLAAFPAFEEELTELGASKTTAERRLELVASLDTHSPSAEAKDALSVFADLARQRAPNDARIAQSIYEAGHHTPFQHPTFVFSLDNVSRNVVESFFHQHTFFNSEQQSQRYVEMGEADVYIPNSIQANPKALSIYQEAVADSWEAYHELRTGLVQTNLKVMTAIGKIKGQTEKQILVEAEKKSQEMARYVIPVAAATRLYHTISGIVLLRYIRMAGSQNTSEEARLVANQMLHAVAAIDPDFVREIKETPHDEDAFPEWALIEEGESEHPLELGHDHSILLNATPDATELVTQVLREVTGSRLPQDELLSKVLDPALNRIWNDTLNTWDHSPVLRSLRHVHYTFHKRLSLSAVAQDQRHRMTPGTRPLLQRLLTETPDVYVPDVMAGDAGDTYHAAMDKLWVAMHKLRALGIPSRDATYLLPNATNQYFTQSGDLLSFIHKWRLRLCFNAQKEIFDASLDELRQVQAAHPELTRFLGPPCTFVAARQSAEDQDSVSACCPEGPRWCGVKVWKGFDAEKGKPKRPY
jgi:thymidylate synthase ThyX